jgi:murein L,D-transpeptidase YcbB/YkuD
LALSHEPTFDEGTAQRIREAALSYSDLAVRGGWPTIPAEAKFALGVAGPHDELFRQRLMVGDDLAPTYRDRLAGRRRTIKLQVRHGLAATGTNTAHPRRPQCPVQKRIRQLEASLERIQNMNFQFGQRYVVVNLPATFAEAVENDTVVRRYRVIVGKTEKPSPTLTAEITGVILNPTWTVPSSIAKTEIRRICGRIPAISHACTWKCWMPMTIRSTRGRWIGPARARRISPYVSRTAPGTRWAR